MANVLVVDDDAEILRTLERVIRREGHEVTAAPHGADAIERLDGGQRFDLIVSDLDMPKADGRAVLAAGTRHRIPVVILTGHNDVKTAVALMRAGAANFVTKPFTPASLKAVLEDAFGRKAAAPVAASTSVVGGDASFKQVLEQIESVAGTDATVLLSGESGTGKEVVARLIHASSARAAGPFVAVNCGAIPEALLESEMFGHAKGAFTGATHARAGRFELAAKGTLFLDEIGDMPLAFQVKLLRVLQERQFEVLGDGTPRAANVRVIAATHRDLRERVRDGEFREDLYYRINVVELALPALRDRRTDIPLLVDHFIAASNARHQRSVTGASPDLLAAMIAYTWPGNVRQLANVVERMVIFRKQGALEKTDLPPLPAGDAAKAAADPQTLPPEGIDLKRAVAEFEGSLIEQALTRTEGNRNAAAQLLGLNRTTLVEKLKRKPPSND